MAGKILIIDDDRDITQIIRILLEGEGFETCTAYSGTQALASLDETVELIILDIMMDGMNGFEVCHRIRESSYVPILFLSAMSGDSEKVAALMAGGDDYLCKPFSAAELTGQVPAAAVPGLSGGRPGRAGAGAPGAGHGQQGHGERPGHPAVLYGV